MGGSNTVENLTTEIKYCHDKAQEFQNRVDELFFELGQHDIDAAESLAKELTGDYHTNPQNTEQ